MYPIFPECLPRDASVTPVTDRSFGLLIAYIIPGFTVILLWGEKIPIVAGWLSSGASAPPTVGGFLTITVASVLVGLILSTLRWAIVDSVHHHSGIMPPTWEDPGDPSRLALYQLVVEFHYRFYQFYGSMWLVLLFLAITPPGESALGDLSGAEARLVSFFLALLFFAASRDTLQKCYLRGSTPGRSYPLYERKSTMTNGGHYGTITGAEEVKHQGSTPPDVTTARGTQKSSADTLSPEDSPKRPARRPEPSKK